MRITKMEFVPSFSIPCFTEIADPLPTAVRTMTEETPINTPKTVRLERKRLAAIPRHAKRQISRKPKPPISHLPQLVHRADESFALPRAQLPLRG